MFIIHIFFLQFLDETFVTMSVYQIAIQDPGATSAAFEQEGNLQALQSRLQ